MQASLEAEARGKAEAIRAKKKLENDINELEMSSDGANRSRAEAEKMIKKYQTQVSKVIISYFWKAVHTLRTSHLIKS